MAQLDQKHQAQTEALQWILGVAPGVSECVSD